MARIPESKIWNVHKKYSFSMTSVVMMAVSLSATSSGGEEMTI